MRLSKNSSHVGTGGYIIPVWTMGLVKRKFGWQADALSGALMYWQGCVKQAVSLE